MNNISQIYSMNLYNTIPVFKQKNTITTKSNPIQYNAQMNGLNALAGYNYNLVNKKNDFDIPTLKMIPVPQNITDINGEKVYLPNGEIDYVVKNDGKFKTIYYNDEYKTIKVIDKNTNKIIQEQGCYVANTNEVRVCKNLDDSIGYFTDYDVRNGEMVPIGKGKHIYYADDTKKEFIHWLESNEYQLIERSNVSKDAYFADRVINYDEKGNIINIEEFNKT